MAACASRRTSDRTPARNRSCEAAATAWPNTARLYHRAQGFLWPII